MAATGAGFNPYRKANGEFASPNEVNEAFEKQVSVHSSAGETEQAEKVQKQYDEYVMDKQPESDRAQELFKQQYGTGTIKKSGGLMAASALSGKVSTNATPAQRNLILGSSKSPRERKSPEAHGFRASEYNRMAAGHRKQRIIALATLRFDKARKHATNAGTAGFYANQFTQKAEEARTADAEVKAA